MQTTNDLLLPLYFLFISSIIACETHDPSDEIWGGYFILSPLPPSPDFRMRDLGGFVVAVLHVVVTSGIQGVRRGPSNAAGQDGGSVNVRQPPLTAVSAASRLLDPGARG
jgi:hypothetical protein